MCADSLAESTPNAPEFICTICLHKPKSSGFQWKKASLGVHSPFMMNWNRMKNKDHRLFLVEPIFKKTFSLDLWRKKKFLVQTTRNHAQILAITTERQTKINAVQTWFPRIIMIKVVSSIYIEAKVRPPRLL